MEKFTTLTSKACPIALRDVDTDMIIPAQYLTSVSKEGFAEGLFRRMRDEDPNFSLNQERYKSSKILIADDNFGCGSSREHAVWALKDWGFKVIIGKSFADIFSTNSAKNGLLLIELEERIVDNLLNQAADELTLTVDLENQIVKTTQVTEYKFNYDPFRKHCLLNGLDDLDYILSKQKQIKEFREKQKDFKFFDTSNTVG